MEAGDQFSQCPNTLSMRSTEQNQHDLSGSQCIGGGMVPLFVAQAEVSLPVVEFTVSQVCLWNH